MQMSGSPRGGLKPARRGNVGNEERRSGGRAEIPRPTGKSSPTARCVETKTRRSGPYPLHSWILDSGSDSFLRLRCVNSPILHYSITPRNLFLKHDDIEPTKNGLELFGAGTSAAVVSGVRNFYSFTGRSLRRWRSGKSQMLEPKEFSGSRNDERRWICSQDTFDRTVI